MGSVGKLIGIGLNYSDHAAEAGMAIPKEPIVFLKATSCIAGPYDDVLLPSSATKTDWEVELAFVVGTRARHVTEADALSHVAGYCIVNDVSERRFQSKLSGQWTKGKSCDTFGPVGPWLVTPDAVGNVQSLDMSADVSGERMQTGNTATMIFTVAQIIAHLSEVMRLEPGDVIATGTPPARVLWSGDADPAIAAMLAARGIAGAAAPDPLAVSGSFAHGELQLDLSQDTAAAVEALRRALLPWRLPAAMVLVALVLWSAGMSAEIGGLRAEARAQRSAAEEIARIALLPAGPILDLRAQIARATATLDDAQDEQAETVPPLETLRRAGAVLAGDAAEVARVSLRPGAGLLVDLELADFAALDGLVGALRASGLTPRVAQSGTREGGQVQATLMLGTGDRPAVTGGTAQ